MKVLIVCQSAYGHVKLMADKIQEGLKDSDIESTISTASETNPEDILNYDALLLGSPVRMGSIGDKMKIFIDKLGQIWLQAKAKNKIGGVFVSSGGYASGIELTQIALFSTLIELGMVMVGFVDDMPGYGKGANQWGPFAQVGADGKSGPSEDCFTACYEYGKRVAWAVEKFA